jgi:hypothetical protein
MDKGVRVNPLFVRRTVCKDVDLKKVGSILWLLRKFPLASAISFMISAILRIRIDPQPSVSSLGQSLEGQSFTWQS